MQANIIIGIFIIILNIVPFILKKPKLLFLTALITLILLYIMNFLKI